MEKICSLCNTKFYSDCDVCEDCNSFTKFTQLVEDQFIYGGQKYALNGSEVRESTDVLFEKHGKNWLIGTIDKYTFRFQNLSRERDLLKIACYMYIMWLKRGFYIRPDGINDPPLDTNIMQKKEHFWKFVDKVRNDYVDRRKDSYYKELEEINKKVPNNFRYLFYISDSLGKMSKRNWVNIEQYDLISIFNYSFLTWVEKFANIDVHDTDTNTAKK